MKLSIDSNLKLNNGVEIPIIGLGTWALYGKDAYQSVIWALDLGYRLIDTASFYDNELQVGRAIKEGNISRDEVFVTTKVWNSDQGYERTLAAFEKSLKNLSLTYVDLYLIHWPVSDLRNDTWKALEKIYLDGKARAIGISNFTIRHIDELLNLTETIPTINQVEFSPFLFQKELMEYCQSKNIALEGYCPLTRGRRFNNPIIKTTAQKHDKSPAQILLRWGLQHDIVEIPKSGNKEHLKDNISIFDFVLDKEDMENLDKLNEDFRVVDDPHLIE